MCVSLTVVKFMSCVIHISTDVYLSLNGEVIPNHGYVEISDIGSSDTTALLCHTDRPPPPGSAISGGNWFSPDGTRVVTVGSSDVPGFERNRGPMVVRLRRKSGSAPDQGIYQCAIQEQGDTGTVIVYVGLYIAGGGSYVECHTMICYPINYHRSCLTVWWYGVHSAPLLQ